MISASIENLIIMGINRLGIIRWLLEKLEGGGIMTKVNTEEYRNIDPNINSGCDSGAVACI